MVVAAEEKSERLQQQSNDDNDDEFFTGTIQRNKNTSWLIIPRKLATRYRLDKRTNVLLLPKKDGILLKRLTLNLS